MGNRKVVDGMAWDARDWASVYGAACRATLAKNGVTDPNKWVEVERRFVFFEGAYQCEVDLVCGNTIPTSR